MSPDSFEIAAELGLGAMMFSQFPYETVVDQINAYRQDFRAKHGEEPPPIVTADFVSIDKDAKKAEAMGREKIIEYLVSVLDHYEMLDKSHFAETGGSYQHYANAADAMKEMGHEAMCEGFLQANLWGDPAMIREKLEARRELIGDFETSGCFSYSSIPYDHVRASMKLFAEEVGPMLHGWERQVK
jgi:alkanesulfonate monooxygenase SsuD/methylene tetrahydromethanopterin reductase-like flavin-dependent oxidoreductase (luciferase family)